MGKSLKGKELGIGITQRKDGKYSAKFKSRSGKRIEKYFSKLQEARKWLAEAKHEDTHGNIGRSSDMTVDAWFDYWITNIKRDTIKWRTVRGHKDRYNKNIKENIGNMIISNVKPMHCQNVINIMNNNKYSFGTMEKTKQTMSAMFSGAVENGIITTNPITKSIKIPPKEKKDAKFMSIAEQEKFLNSAKLSVNYWHFLFVLQTGLRSSELRGLKWGDIDFQNRVIHVRRNTDYNLNEKKFASGELKTNSGKRDIPITDTAYDALITMKERNERRNQKIVSIEFSDNIFLNSNGNFNRSSDYCRCLKSICDKAGIERISMHTLRHTFATRCIESGMKPKTLQKILGHSKISMTMDLYVHVTDDEKEKEMKKFSEIYRMA